MSECPHTIKQLREALRHVSAERDALFDASMQLHHEERPIRAELRLTKDSLLRITMERDAMRPVVDGAIESYAELGALDLRVGDIVDEDDVRLWRQHEEAIGVPLRAYRATRAGEHA